MSPQLVAKEGLLAGQHLVFEEGDEWTIGRDAETMSFSLEDAKVSRYHARVERVEEGFLLHNVSETNPTRVNDRALSEPHLLQEGDRVQIGATFFLYTTEALSPEEEAEEFKLPKSSEQEEIHEAIFREEAPADVSVDLTSGSRFVLKMVSGPNSGAEFALEEGRDYLLGTDSAQADVVLHDLSVSREHARLYLDKEGHLRIEDLESRNGVVVEGHQIEGSEELLPNQIVSLGTSAFLVIDQEAPAQTIATPTLGRIAAAHEEEEAPVEEEEAPPPPKEKKEKQVPSGAMILAAIFIGLALILGVGAVSLLQEREVKIPAKEYQDELAAALKDFPGVKYTFNQKTRRLFLVGHVVSGVRKNELFYNLRGLNFIAAIDDNVVDDEAVWQEFNILISKNPAWKGVSMHSPSPGRFVLTGYLQEGRDAASLSEWINIHFNYLDRLDNQVVVEEIVLEQILGSLRQAGIGGVVAEFSNGDLTLTGYIPSRMRFKLRTLATQFEEIHGVRNVRNFVVALSPEEAVTDLSERFPNRFVITGHTRHCDVNVNVVINGKIYSRGDVIEGFLITSIQPQTIYLERDGLKYKLQYNK